MEKTFNLLAAICLSVLFLPGCHVNSAKVVETEKETTECVVGTWKPENQDKELNNLVFHAPNMQGAENGDVNLTGGVEQANGIWKYESIGQIKISTASSELNFKLLDCKRGIIDGLTIYIKE